MFVRARRTRTQSRSITLMEQIPEMTWPLVHGAMGWYAGAPSSLG